MQFMMTNLFWLVHILLNQILSLLREKQHSTILRWCMMHSNDDDANIWWSTTPEGHLTFMAGEHVQFVGTFEDLKLCL